MFAGTAASRGSPVHEDENRLIHLRGIISQYSPEMSTTSDSAAVCSTNSCVSGNTTCGINVDSRKTAITH